jgi:hypothetical protein
VRVEIDRVGRLQGPIMIGWSLVAIGVVGLLGIGVGALAAPGAAAAQYGIVLDDPRAAALLRAMGVRDLSLGLLLGLVAAGGDGQIVAGAVLALVPVAVVDLLVVARERRLGPSTRAAPYAVFLHAGGVIGLFATAVALHLGV